MKYIKISLLVAVLATTFTSCLKSRSDQGGLLDDPGTIVTSIAEKQYLNTDAQNIGAGYVFTGANLNFLTRPNEAVKFFTVSVSQPRSTKLSGNLVLNVTASAYDGESGGAPYPFTPDPIPAGAINVQPITIPASDAPLITVPVLFTVNKALLDPTTYYGVKFTITSANQGVISQLDNSINVMLNYSDFNDALTVTQNVSDITANYQYHSTFYDPVNQYTIDNKKTEYLMEIAPNQVEYGDQYVYALAGSLNQNLEVNNTTTGARTAIFRPRFILNTAGQVTAVQNPAGVAAVTNLALDPSGVNKFTYSANNVRSLNVKYTFTLTTTINGVLTPRTVKVSEDFTYDPNQVYF